MNKKVISIALACFLLAGCSSSANPQGQSYESSTSSPASAPSSSEPNFYDEMKNDLYLYLKNHNDITQNFDDIVIERGKNGFHFKVYIPSYETYTFAAVTCATVDAVREIVKKQELDEFEITVNSPILDTKYFIMWNATKFEGGILTERGPQGSFSDYYTLSKMLSKYGYEDFEGKLSNHVR